jgi:hypothetical protein
MFSPRELKAYDRMFDPRTTKPRDGIIIPKFIFSLNNKSTDPNPRKQAFKFRDGLIIITTPIFSDEDVFRCLKKACHGFDNRPPFPSDLIPITHHIPATQSIAHVQCTANYVKERKPNPVPKKQAEWLTNYSYFIIQQNTITHTPDSQSPASPAHSLPTYQQRLLHTEHVEDAYEKVVDNRSFRNRLVPSAKMEAARRKHLTKNLMAEATKEEGLESPALPAGHGRARHS